MRTGRVAAVVAAGVVVAGAVVVVVVRSAAGPVPSGPRTGSDLSGVTRPFGPTAPWNVAVAGLPNDPRSDDWRDRLWWFGIANADPDHPEADPSRGRFGVEFGFDPAGSDFSVPLYSAADATTTRRVRHRAGWKGGWNLGPNDRIPWNPGWRPSQGSDAKAVVIDPATGRQWSLWGLADFDEHGDFDDAQCLGNRLGGDGYDRRTDLCAGGVSLTQAPDGTPMDYRTYTGNDPAARGSGIPELAMMVMPSEVRSGTIEHALSMVVYNTMIGPRCDASVTDTSSPAFGTTCGDAVAPAGQFEGVRPTTPCGPDGTRHESLEQRRRRTVPEGMRFALRISDADIDAWLDSRRYSGALRDTARTFAVALRDYGWFITGTSCYSAEIIAAGATNPETATAWRGLGIDGTGKDLLWGLFQRERIVTIASAFNECANGSVSRFACPAGVTRY